MTEYSTPLAPSIFFRHLPLRTSQSRMVPSYEAVASTLQSVDLNLLAKIVSVCPPELCHAKVRCSTL